MKAFNAAIFFLFFPLILFAQVGPIPRFDSSSDYLCYYGSWDAQKVIKARAFDLVILDSHGITRDQVQAIRSGVDGILGTDDDVIVVAYISIGEDHLGNHIGNGKGPVYWDSQSKKMVFTNKGLASWYLDDANHDGKPDQNGTWGSYYVNAGDSLWQEFVRTMPEGADYIINVLGCDGLFLDTIDTASPWTVYSWTSRGMSAFIARLHQWYPDKILVANRGLFYFNPNLDDYNYTIRPFINAVMFEGYYLDWDWNTHRGKISPYFNSNKYDWAPKINAEARKSDGFTVLCLDYLNPAQGDYQTLFNQQYHEAVEVQGWVDYISSIYLDEIRYDIFHHHASDENPPTWPNWVGTKSAVAGDGMVTVRWQRAIDQSEPVYYNIYYGPSSPLNLSEAVKLSHIPTQPDSNGYDYSYTIAGLTNGTTYYFVVRAEDSAPTPHEDYNCVEVQATPGSQSHEIRIRIDGAFDDWKDVPRLDQSPNEAEAAGDASNSDVDLVDVWAYNDSRLLYVCYQVAGTVRSNYFYHVFIDVDRDSATGYAPNGSVTGADFMVENSNLWRYTGSGGEDWSWTSGGSILYGKQGGSVEIGIPLSALGLTISSTGVNLLFNVNDLTDAPDDYAPSHYQQNTYSYAFGLPSRVLQSPQTSVPGQWQLKPAYPNPFATGSGEPAYITIPIQLNQWVEMNLALYSILGEKVAIIFLGKLPAGRHEFSWNGKNTKGQNLPSGVYFVVAKSASTIHNQKIVLLRR